MHRHRTHSAFTLVELLVVISIIAMLIAILIPALSQARGVSQNLVCMSNQKQIGIATAGYATESKNFYPIGSMYDLSISKSLAHRWYIALGPYLNNDPLPANTPAQMTTPTLTGRNYSWDYRARGRVLGPAVDGGYSTYSVSTFGKSNVYTCPSTTGIVANTGAQPGPFPGAWDVDYQINGCVTGYWTATVPRAWYQPPKRNIVNPASAFAFMDGNTWDSQSHFGSYSHPCLGVGAEYAVGILYPNTYNKSMFINRHKNGTAINVSFFDGHGESNWTFDRLAYTAYGGDYPLRNAFWRGDSTEYVRNWATPF